MPRPRQLALDLPSRPALGRDAFFVSPANAVALGLIDRWPAWPERRLALTGPPGAGKTHLAHVWAARAAALILPAADLPGFNPGGVPLGAALAVEDADRLADLGPNAGAAEETLFHLCNRLGPGGGSLLVTGRSAPAFWPVALPDLASRLQAAAVAALDAPDDALLGAVLGKLFADRGVGVSAELVRYLLARMDRSFEAAERLVAALDRAALARGRPITIPLAAEILAAQAGCGQRRDG